MIQLFASAPLIIGVIGFLLGIAVSLLVVWVVMFRMYGRE